MLVYFLNEKSLPRFRLKSLLGVKLCLYLIKDLV